MVVEYEDIYIRDTKSNKVVGIHEQEFVKHYAHMFSDPHLKKTESGVYYTVKYNGKVVPRAPKALYDIVKRLKSKPAGGVPVMHNVASSSSPAASSKPKGKRPVTRCPKTKIIRFQYADNTSLQRQKVCNGVDPVNITKKQYEKYRATMKTHAPLVPRKIKRGPRKPSRPAASSSAAAEKKKRVRKLLPCAQRNDFLYKKCLNNIPSGMPSDEFAKYLAKCVKRKQTRAEGCNRDPSYRFRAAKGEGKKKASTGRRPGRSASGKAKPRRMECPELRKRVYASCKKPTPRKGVVRTDEVCNTISKRRFDKCQIIGTGPRRVVKPKGLLNEVFGMGLF